jgi:hypothetical protein
MKQPYIALCGASDIKRVSNKFKKVVHELYCQPGDYVSGTTPHFDESYIGASLRTIKEADIIVFNLIDIYGDLTWNQEYKKVIELKKVYCIMIHQDILIAFERIKNNKNAFKGNSAETKIFKLIAELVENQKPFVPFNEDNYEEVLRKEICFIFFRGLQLLTDEIAISPVISMIKRNDDAELAAYQPSEEDFKAMKDAVINTKDKKFKEYALLFLGTRKALSDKELLELIDKGSQIVGRVIYQHLPKLVNTDSDYHSLINKMVEIIKSDGKDEVFRINQGVPAFFELDPGVAVRSLGTAFPARKINLPIRVMQCLNTYFEGYKSYITDAVFLETLNHLAGECRDYDPNDKRLKEGYNSLQEKIAKLNS